MAKYTVLIPEELKKINAVIVSRSEMEHVIGMLEGMSWGIPAPYADALCLAVGKLEDMLDGKN